MQHGTLWRTLRPALRAACALALAACSEPTAPIPQDATEFTPPSHYAFWWSLTQQCSGRTARYEDVRWYSVPANYVAVQNGDTLTGEWFPRTNQIVLSQSGLKDPELIRHEMLHSLMNQTTHARDAFLTRCNGYVSCVDQCARDVSPIDTLPQPGAEELDPTKLNVRLAIAPDSVTAAANDGWFVIVLSVTNPIAHAVRVRLPRVVGNTEWILAHGFTIGPSGPPAPTAFLDGGSAYRFENDSLGFDAGETRNLVIDESSTKLRLQPGVQYSVQAWFNVDTAKTLSFTFR